ncbi:MAG TPA: hypothetical protein VKM55_27395 [Candidatus Lokiarchaeia archaeon]|nr:hypothetical protein [Candidatus Lokiarchaeia archaeon]
MLLQLDNAVQWFASNTMYAICIYGSMISVFLAVVGCFMFFSGVLRRIGARFMIGGVVMLIIFAFIYMGLLGYDAPMDISQFFRMH